MMNQSTSIAERAVKGSDFRRDRAQTAAVLLAATRESAECTSGTNVR